MKTWSSFEGIRRAMQARWQAAGSPTAPVGPPCIFAPNPVWLVGNINTADITPIVHGSDGNPGTSIFALREGVERFFITDINNPGSATMAQSSIAVMWDTISAQISGDSHAAPQATPSAMLFNHVPGGGNVLFMDGHVEFIRWHGQSTNWQRGVPLEQQAEPLVGNFPYSSDLPTNNYPRFYGEG